MKNSSILIFFLLIILLVAPTFADKKANEFEKLEETKTEKPEEKQSEFKYRLEAGTKGTLSAEISPTYVYFKPYLNTGFSHKYFGILAGYSRYINYQLTDGLSYEYIGFNEISANADITPFEFLEVSFDFEYYFGDTFGRYEKYQYLFGLNLDFEKFAFSADFDFGNTGYLFLGTNYTASRNFDISAEISYNHSENLSFDLTYIHNNFTSDVPTSYIYSKNTFRIGVLGNAIDKIFLTGGIIGGFDSNSYGIAGFDVGANMIFWNHLKIFILYSLQYNISPTALSTGKKNTSLSSVSSSYLSNRLIFGVAFKL